MANAPYQFAAESASGSVCLCLTQAEERDVFKAAHEMLTERVRVSDNERVRLSAQLEEKEESENLLRNEFERMRVSVEEMVTQKSHQFGRAQASTALPGSSSCSRCGLGTFRLTRHLCDRWSMSAVTAESRRGPRSPAIPGMTVIGEGRLGMVSTE